MKNVNAKRHPDSYLEPNFSLGFSPCPNDTFMFDALVNNKIDTDGFSFSVQLEDIETLNRMAIKNVLDITKISFGVYPLIMDKYELLTSGSALGKGVGPILISKKEFTNPRKEIQSVAIPGKNTTAYFLFKKYFPELSNMKEMIFSKIEQAILDGIVDAGVIIHENRFTYSSKGLKKISDLGELWEKETGLPIPLGGIVIKRDLDVSIKKQINQLLKQSIEFAFQNPEKSKNYIKKHSQEMSDDVIKKHIDLYVNDLSINIGKTGRTAISLFLKDIGLINIPRDLFVISES